MKKYICVAIYVLFILSLAGCGSSGTSAPAPAPADTASALYEDTMRDAEQAALEPMATQSSDTLFTPSGTGSCVTFTGNIVEVSKAQVGDMVLFGSYEQDNDISNGAEAIEWLVLDRQDEKLLLLSKDSLDCKKYNEEGEKVTWETCTLRSWLNGEFYNTAFSQTEQTRIATTTVKNGDNPKTGTEGGNDTEDKVFLLSIEEVLLYFDPDPNAYDPARRAHVTRYAFENGAYICDEDTNTAGTVSVWMNYSPAGTDWWWLRSPGDGNSLAVFVNDRGRVVCGGSEVDGGWRNYSIDVRPAFWLNLEP